MTGRIAIYALLAVAVCVPATASGMASAELYTTSSYLYGRFDARIQHAPGDGVVSAFFLWKNGSDASGAYWNELDYEKIAADCHMQLNNIYGNPKSQHQSTPSLGFAICGGYHDYRFEWTPTYIAWVVDGKEIRRDTGADATAYAQNASAGMTIHFNIWPGNSSFGGNINNTTLPVHQYISWVEYSSYDNGNFNVQWREEFESSAVPSGWATGNWASPYNLSTHSPQNVAFVNGIAVLSLTADNATGNPGTPPADSSAGGTGGGSGGAGGISGAGGTTSVGGGGGSTSSSGGTMSTGGTTHTGGTTTSGGTTATGGSPSTGGRTSTGGTTTSGGTTGSGGSSPAGGSTASGGGTTTAGGSVGAGGTTTSGGTTGAGGSSHTGGAIASGGTIAAGGSISSGGTTATVATTATGGEAGGGSAGTATTGGGCSCSTVPAASPLGPVLVLLFLFALRSRRKAI